MAKLGDVCTIVSGTTPKSNCPEYWDGDINWVTPAELNDDSDVIYESQRKITEQAVQNSSLKPFPAGTVLLSSRAPIGKVAIAGVEMYCNQGFKNLICSNRIYNRYLYHFLKNSTEYLNSLGRGATFKEISKRIVENIEIPLPPLDEQRRISAVLDKVSGLIAKRREQLDKLDELVKARFVEMFGNFIFDRDRWEICKVGLVADTIDPQPSHRTPPVSTDGIPYIGIAECNYETWHIDFEKARKVGKNVLREHQERYTLDNGDFIIGKIGTIGKPFPIPAKQTYTLSANTILIKPIKNKVMPQFLFAVFQSEYMDRIIDAEKKSTSQPAFGIQKVRNIEMPLPPMKLQQGFSDFVEQLDKSKLTIQQSLDKLEVLKKALMQQYFG